MINTDSPDEDIFEPEACKIDPWKGADSTCDPRLAQDYFNEMLATNDQVMILTCLDDIARAIGMSEAARRVGIPRESLYRALTPSADPRLSTILKIMAGLGLKFPAVPSDC